MNTSVEYQNINLTHATRYYFTVTAVNAVGLYTTISSDGFIVDTTKPSTGVVYNSAAYRDVAFQSSSSELKSSWHGFQDHCSGIQTYFVALVDNITISPLNFTSAGFHTTYTFKELSLGHGISYYAAVKAVDAAGHESDVAFSAPVTIDTSPPSGYQCDIYTNIYPNVSSSYKTHSIIETYSMYMIENNMYKIGGTISNATYVNLVLQIDHLGIPITLKRQHNGSYAFTYTFVSKYTGKRNFNLTYSNENDQNIIYSTSISRCNDTFLNDSFAIEAMQVAPNQLSVDIMIMDLESGLRKVKLFFLK